MSEYISPVMYVDPSGCFAISDNYLRAVSGVLIAAGLVVATVCTAGGALLIAGVLVGAGGGSLFVGNFVEENGGEFSDGWTAGLVAGAIMGGGTGLAGGIMFAESTTALTYFSGMAVTYTVGFASGFRVR